MTFTCTGVKHLHHAAKAFDVGIYFEANGHGTVLFKPEFIETLDKITEDPALSPDIRQAARQLRQFANLINPYVGDALTDLLAVEVILENLNWSLSQWDSLYEPLPNKMTKLYVKDRSAFKTTDAERILVEPAGIQAKINAFFTKDSMERATVR